MRRRRSRYQPLPPTCHPERSEGSRYVPIVIRRLINTSRQGGVRHSAAGRKYETPDSLRVESGVFLYGSQAVEVFLTAVLKLFEIGELFVRGICNKFLGLIREAFEIFMDHYSGEGNAYFLQAEK